MKKQKHYDLGIVLSGGGARGIAHIGVLKALEELDIHPQIIAGCSAGSIVGALYASGMKSDEMVEFVKSASLLKVFKPGMSVKGLINISYLRTHFSKFTDVSTFEELKKPLYITISNLNTGQYEIRSSGALLEVVQASSAIPLVFLPVELGEQTYVDGGLLLNLPARAIRPQVDKLIGVDLMPRLEIEQNKLKGLLSMANIATRCFHLSVINNSLPERERCDLVIEPKGIDNYTIFQFNKVKELVEAGYEGAMEMEERLKALVGQSQP